MDAKRELLQAARLEELFGVETRIDRAQWLLAFLVSTCDHTTA